MEARADLRRIFAEQGHIPDETLRDDRYFTNFRLSLPARVSGIPNKLHGLDYDSLGDYKLQFDLRTVRNVIIRQNSPKGDDSSVYEIFSRLNSGE